MIDSSKLMGVEWRSMSEDKKAVFKQKEAIAHK